MSSSKNKAPCALLENAEVTVEAKGTFAVARRVVVVDPRRCKRCDGQAHESYVDGNGYEILSPCEGTRLDTRIERFNTARIPARYHDASFDTFRLRMPDHPVVLEELKRYLQGFVPGDRGRLFAGGVGTGKTHLLTACLRYLTLEKSIACMYVEFSHLVADIREGYSQSRSESEMLTPLAHIPVLAIDELGKGRLRSEFEQRIIDELISRRYNDAGVSTFFATNYFPHMGNERGANAGQEFLSDRIGERSQSRAFDLCEFIYLSGEDYRADRFKRGF
ncbi:MAG: hypothetical protein AUK47_21335 [Deltaproteobacteria bacterium CG2_30_63_29]|nr:MAG: hypothetical protein AUK47_21335 [Deltaproteobacteria bacterium CG2_30_63_29]PJB49020.1 MAG: AAA family ATPase [Deltaproteobacteria bacterium CG_4_9_14_3_um_filter_63_12]